MGKYPKSPNSMEIHSNTFQKYQENERQEKTEELPQILGDQGNKTIKCNTGCCTGFWNKKKTSLEKLVMFKLDP